MTIQAKFSSFISLNTFVGFLNRTNNNITIIIILLGVIICKEEKQCNSYRLVN